MLSPYPSYTTYTHEREVLSETLQVSDYAHGDALNTEYARGSAGRACTERNCCILSAEFVYLFCLFNIFVFLEMIKQGIIKLLEVYAWQILRH